MTLRARGASALHLLLVLTSLWQAAGREMLCVLEDRVPSTVAERSDIPTSSDLVLQSAGADADALHEDEKVELRGFGSFRIRERRSRQGRNPKTGAKVPVPPKRIPYFKPGKELRELLNAPPKG